MIVCTVLIVEIRVIERMGERGRGREREREEERGREREEEREREREGGREAGRYFPATVECCWSLCYDFDEQACHEQDQRHA